MLRSAASLGRAGDGAGRDRPRVPQRDLRRVRRRRERGEADAESLETLLDAIAAADTPSARRRPRAESAAEPLFRRRVGTRRRTRRRKSRDVAPLAPEDARNARPVFAVRLAVPAGAPSVSRERGRTAGSRAVGVADLAEARAMAGRSRRSRTDPTGPRVEGRRRRHRSRGRRRAARGMPGERRAKMVGVGQLPVLEQIAAAWSPAIARAHRTARSGDRRSTAARAAGRHIITADTRQRRVREGHEHEVGSTGRPRGSSTTTASPVRGTSSESSRSATDGQVGLASAQHRTGRSRPSDSAAVRALAIGGAKRRRAGRCASSSVDSDYSWVERTGWRCSPFGHDRRSRRRPRGPPSARSPADAGPGSADGAAFRASLRRAGST